MFESEVLIRNIKKLRESKGISQKELAERLFISGQAISKWERGLAVPDIEKICMLAEIFGVSVDSMLGYSNERKPLMVAVDGGGTKAEYIVFDKNGKIYERLVTEGSNPNFYGRDKVCEKLKENINMLMNVRSNIQGVYIGSAGFLTGDNGEYIKSYLRNAFPALKIKCTGDIFNAMACGTEEEKCICSISGTGNIAFAYKNGDYKRYGGYGVLFDKAGSGYDIGREGLLAALQEADGLGEKTLITPLVENRIGGAVFGALTSLYNENVSYIASFAESVFEALKKGDGIAKKIVEESTSRVAHIINTAYTQNTDCTQVVLAGSLYKNSYFYDSVKSKLKKDLQCTVAEKPQVYGACILCLKMMGYPTNGLKKNFDKEYNLIMRGN